jgi:hypothetical protein
MASTVLREGKHEKMLASLGIYLNLPHDLILEVLDFFFARLN